MRTAELNRNDSWHQRSYTNFIFIIAVFIIAASFGACTLMRKKTERFVVRGDLHVHSSYSHDSAVPAEKVIEDSAKTGYDFIALTEHNTINHLKKDLSTKEVTVLPGYELTLSTGHINLFGVRSFEERISMIKASEITEFLNYFHDLGGYAQINHPNDPLYSAEFGYDIPMDFIEVWNNSKFGEDDKKTLEDWHNLLCEGRKIVATGGTDEHKVHLNRSPFNNVFVEEKTANNILDNIKKGHLYITATKDGPDIQLTCGTAIMGDTVEFTDKKSVSLKIDRLASNSIIKVYSDKGLEHEEKYNDAKSSAYQKELAMNGRTFYRVEIWTSSNTIAAISNPIFIRSE